MKKHDTHETQPEEPVTPEVVDTPAPEAREAQLEAEKAALVEQLQRLQAEFINYRGRIEREQQEQKIAASDKMLHEFLPVIDNLQLALQHAKDGDGKVKGEDLLAGLLMIMEQMKQLLEHQGLAEIPTDGERFDPHRHEALTIIAQDGAERGQILQTYQRGYMKNGKLFRAAKVSVAK